MSDRKAYYLRYESIESWENYDEEVNKAVEEDQGGPAISTKTLPPIYVNLQLTAEAVDKLKHFEGVLLEEIPEDD
ncbi:hypothetical protein DTO271D3_1501 [Paecilomyces variotii]|nr:hypothetical protein DTO217A2_3217 [Paecilomyces variotii]KAJ9318244.1 hypothetical protein DTO271D3_1501 [Paecilomyces variotii]